MPGTQRSLGRLALCLAAAAVCLFSVARCGLSACVGGVGFNGQQDCAGGSTPVSPQGSGAFTLAISPGSVVVGQTAQAIASGGKSGPYVYSIDPGSNPGPASPLAGTINPSTGLYQAPTSISPNTTETITIRATDATNGVRTVTVTVTSG